LFLEHVSISLGKGASHIADKSIGVPRAWATGLVKNYRNAHDFTVVAPEEDRTSVAAIYAFGLDRARAMG